MPAHVAIRPVARRSDLSNVARESHRLASGSERRGVDAEFKRATGSVPGPKPHDARGIPSRQRRRHVRTTGIGAHDARSPRNGAEDLGGGHEQQSSPMEEKPSRPGLRRRRRRVGPVDRAARSSHGAKRPRPDVEERGRGDVGGRREVHAEQLRLKMYSRRERVVDAPGAASARREHVTARRGETSGCRSRERRPGFPAA